MGRYCGYALARAVAAVALIQGAVVGGAVQTARAGCLESSVTQLETNQCVGDKRRAADAELNVIYQRLQKLYADRPEFLDKLKRAQRAWIAFRDAEMEARFPGPDKRITYGSVYPMCGGLLLTELTRKRVVDLKVWAEGTQEGDVCSGSIRLRD